MTASWSAPPGRPRPATATGCEQAARLVLGEPADQFGGGVVALAEQRRAELAAQPFAACRAARIEEQPEGAAARRRDQLAQFGQVGLGQAVPAGRGQMAGDVQDGAAGMVERRSDVQAGQARPCGAGSSGGPGPPRGPGARGLPPGSGGPRPSRSPAPAPPAAGSPAPEGRFPAAPGPPAVPTAGPMARTTRPAPASPRSAPLSGGGTAARPAARRRAAGPPGGWAAGAGSSTHRPVQPDHVGPGGEVRDVAGQDPVGGGDQVIQASQRRARRGRRSAGASSPACLALDRTSVAHPAAASRTRASALDRSVSRKSRRPSGTRRRPGPPPRPPPGAGPPRPRTAAARPAGPRHPPGRGQFAARGAGDPVDQVVGLVDDDNVVLGEDREGFQRVDGEQRVVGDHDAGLARGIRACSA